MAIDMGTFVTYFLGKFLHFKSGHGMLFNASINALVNVCHKHLASVKISLQTRTAHIQNARIYQCVHNT